MGTISDPLAHFDVQVVLVQLPVHRAVDDVGADGENDQEETVRPAEANEQLELVDGVSGLAVVQTDEDVEVEWHGASVVEIFPMGEKVPVCVLPPEMYVNVKLCAGNDTAEVVATGPSVKPADVDTVALVGATV